MGIEDFNERLSIINRVYNIHHIIVTLLMLLLASFGLQHSQTIFDRAFLFLVTTIVLWTTLRHGSDARQRMVADLYSEFGLEGEMAIYGEACKKEND